MEPSTGFTGSLARFPQPSFPSIAAGQSIARILGRESLLAKPSVEAAHGQRGEQILKQGMQGVSSTRSVRGACSVHRFGDGLWLQRRKVTDTNDVHRFDTGGDAMFSEDIAT